MYQVITLLSFASNNECLTLTLSLRVLMEMWHALADLGPVYTKHLCQRRYNSSMMLAILFSLKTMKSLQNGVAIHFQATLLLSIRTELLALSQSYRNNEADAWCKRTPNFFNFMQYLKKIGAPPPILGNPGSATVKSL